MTKTLAYYLAPDAQATLKAATTQQREALAAKRQTRAALAANITRAPVKNGAPDTQCQAKQTVKCAP